MISKCLAISKEISVFPVLCVSQTHSKVCKNTLLTNIISKIEKLRKKNYTYNGPFFVYNFCSIIVKIIYKAHLKLQRFTNMLSNSCLLFIDLQRLEIVVFTLYTGVTRGNCVDHHQILQKVHIVKLVKVWDLLHRHWGNDGQSQACSWTVGARRMSHLIPLFG